MNTFYNKAIAIGDSIMAGVILENNKYRYFNKQWFCDIALKYHVEVNNCAKFGQTSGRALAMAQEYLAKNHDYQFAIIELGGNDSNFNWEQIENDPDGEHPPITSLSDFGDNVKKLIELCQSYHLEVIVVNLPPIDAHKYFNHISSKLGGEKIKSWLKNINVIYRVHEMYNNKLVEIASQYNLRIIRIREELLKIRDYSDHLCDDGLHLNTKGYSVVTNILSKLSF